MLFSPDIEIPSTIPKGRAVLTVGEVAEIWHVTPRHVSGLIEEGQLVAIDVSGRRECFPMPVAAVHKLALRLKVTPGQLMDFIRAYKTPANQSKRALWRVPVVEGYIAFQCRRSSLNPENI